MVHYSFGKKIVFLLSLLMFATVNMNAVVPVHINSGNPAYPFPQFLEYSYGSSHKLDNLGTINPEGVVHAEMEQDIRDAYQIFANEWKYTGEVLDGVKYIRGNYGCPYDCREGDGYSMLAAAVMGDKASFDGLWFRIHDSFRPGSKSYLTGETIGGGGYGDLIIGDQANTCSATDGDNEVVLALYIAWRQWGDNSGHKAKNGDAISYKKDLIEVTRGLVAMYEENFKTENPRRVTTGDVGLDGYLKNGTTWPEVTDWANTNFTTMNGVDYKPEYAGPVKMHTDYSSPAYFREFYDLIMELDVPESSEWEREQYRRCEASCDWMVGNWLSQNAKNIFWGEEATISANNVVSMDAGNQGGRFRAAWRTALNYVWHGNPTYTWDPVTHTVKEGGNSYEKESCERIAAFMNDPQGWNGPSPCTDFGGGPDVTYKGPSVLHWDINPDGTFPKSEFTLNWQMGTGMPSAIGAQDLDLAGILYRQCNIEWDCDDFGDGYLTSVPHYFHGFFRWLGMIIATGNHTAPGQIKAGANMKVYRAIKDSVTYAYTGDEITYLLDYRNYGTVDATDVVIVENVPADFVFVSATNGGVYDAGSHTVTWKIGKVAGFKSDDTEGPALNLKSGNLAKTVGQVSYTCKIGSNAFGRYCTTADITCSNGSGWTTNEYPNYVTATMQRNCVDVIKRALKIEKSADREKVNPGNMVKYKIDFENSSEAGWLDGGRPRVTMAMSNNLDGSQLWLRFRLYNDAIEPYINYGNYRIAYYMYDSGIDCLAGEEGCSRGWQWNTSIYEGRRTTSDKVTVTHETIVEGKDDFGAWNQRLCIQFAPLLVTTTAHISNYMQPGRVHKGGTFPLRLAGYLNMSDWSSPNYKDDWSWNAGAADAEDGNYHLISPSWQTIDPLTGKSIEQPITEYLPSICEEPSSLIENVLVEEYDGYAWRRILGTGPMAGREARNVVVIDTLPKGMEFQGFLNECPLKEYKASWDSYQIADGRWCVKWEIPVMQVKQKGTIEYSAMASFPSGAECETPDELTQNVAWILAEKNSPLADTAEVTVTCAKVPEPIIPTTLVKTVDKENVQLGDDVTYTIEYEQTHGAIFDDAAAKTTDWTLSGASISGGVLTTSQGESATFKNSLSVNMYAEFDANIVSYQEGEFFVRDDIRIQYKFNESTGLSVTCYEGSRKVTDATCALKNNPSRWKVKITDDVLQVWFGKDTSASPAFTAEGLKVKEGRMGFRGVGYGAHKYSNIHIHTDYAYDLTIVDRKPAEIAFNSADNGGELLGDSIVWKFEHGMDNPIPFGTKYKVTWKGTVDECNESIINIAYAKLLGHADNEIMAQAVSGCGEECPLPNVTLKLSQDEICAGTGSVTLTAGPTGHYKYQFFEDGEPVTEETEENTYEISANIAGKKTYSVIVTSGTTALPCYSPSEPVVLTVNKRPVGSDYDFGTFCPGNADIAEFEKKFASFADEGIVASWTDSDDEDVDMPSVNDIKKAGTYTYRYKLTSEEGCESKNDYKVSFEVRVISGPTGTGQVSYLLSDTASNGLFDKNLLQMDPSVVEIESGYKYIWYDESGNELGTVAPTPDVPAPGVTKILTYYVNRTQAGGCVSDTMEVSVIVSGTVVPVPNNVTFCLNEEATPITAELGKMEESDPSKWEIVYYDEYGNVLSEAERTPKTNKGGKFTYYVTQREIANPSNESAKVPLTVTVVDIPQPNVSMNRTQYCKGEEYEQLLVESAATPALKGSTFNWSIDGKSVEGVPVAQTQVETITYGVVESYKIDEDHVCQSDTAKLIVKTTFVPKPTGSLIVNYLKEDADDNGQFEPLLIKNSTLVAPADLTEYELMWYDLKENALDETDQAFGPIITKDPSWKENEDVKFSYYVRQRHLESGCVSDTVRITVVISDALIPNTYPMNYCHKAKAISLDNSASINTNNGQVKDIDYELLWFSPEDNYEKPLAEAPVPSTETVGETIYKVAQLNVKDGKYGAKADLKVTIFPNPELKVDKLPQTCGKEILISKYIHLVNTIDTSLLNFYYYQDKDCTKPLEDMKFTESGTLYASAYYTIFSEPNIVGVCASDTMEIHATIDDLTDLKVDAPNSVCPNGEIELSATAKSTTTEDVTFEWSGDATSSEPSFSVTDKVGTFGHEYTFKVEASAGACHLDTTVTVKVGQGELTGAMLVNGTETNLFKTCGDEEITLSTSHTGTDFKWSDLDGNELGEGSELSLTPEKDNTYIVSLINKCEATDTIVVKVYPLTLTADFEKLDTDVCLNSDASATLTIKGYDKSMAGSYIKWFRDGNELNEFRDKTTLSLSKVQLTDGGVYSYEVSNGICLAKNDDERLTATLKVKPFVTFDEPLTYEVPRGEDARLELLNVVPSGATLSWKGSDHEGIGNPFEVKSVTSDEKFEVTLSADDYCDAETKVQLLVDAKVMVTVEADKDLVCVDDAVVLTADTTGTGKVLHPQNYKIEWFAVAADGSEKKLTASGLKATDMPSSATQYYAAVTYGPQEEKSEPVDVDVVSPAQYTKSENVVSCSGESVDINVQIEEGEEPKIKWRDSPSSEFTLSVAPNATRLYDFEITTKGLCPVTDAIEVNVKEKPSVTVKESVKACEGSEISVLANVKGDDIETIVWKDPQEIVISEEKRLAITPEKAGTYTVEANSTACGSAEAAVEVEVVPLPVIELEEVTFSSRLANVVDAEGVYEYKLDQKDWQTDNLFEHLSFNVLHTIFAKDENGCVGMIAFNVEQPPIPIPDYFTPDGSGQNDTWDLTTIMDSYPKSTVKIYDRTGKVIAELDSENQEWDGTYNGHAMPSTDYWYVINVPEIRRQFKGHFTLIRGR
ncbi:MAG: glycosyl hydrolase family 8 [Paludibacteraceae bacterium]|nr:glycosyl hydrolase family 8 [Paludibacteraceae bacterium]